MNQGKIEARLRDHVVYGYRCVVCGFTLDESYGGYLYLKNNNGVRVPLKDKNEQKAVARILFDEDEPFQSDNDRFNEIDDMEERIGYLSACVCMNCLDQFGLDLRKDSIECPQCQSDHVRTILEMTNKRCPKCQSAYMEKMGHGL